MMVDGLMGLMVVDAGRWIPVNLRLFTLVFCSRFLLSSVALVFCSRLFALVFLLSSFCSRLFALVFLLSSCRWYHLYLRTVVLAIRWLIWFERFSATERP